MMMFDNRFLSLAATLAMAAVLPGPAMAQQRGTQVQRSEQAQATTDLRARFGTTTARIAEGQRSGRITRARATALRRQVTQTQTSMTRRSRQQGFVSAAEIASYNDALGAVDLELDDRGVPRGYGNDMLVAPRGGGTQAQQSEHAQATTDLRARFGTTTARIAEGQRSGRITPARATALRRQVTEAQTSMTRLSGQQGFVSAAEIASYNRTLGTVDVELDNRGVPRGYGNDMLVAPRAGGHAR